MLVRRPDCGTVLIEALGSTAVPIVKMPAFSAAVSCSINEDTPYILVIKGTYQNICMITPYMNLKSIIIEF